MSMNYRKRTPDLNLPGLMVLLIAGVIVAIGGISYVVVVNKQLTLRKEIFRSKERMDDHLVAITECQADIEETLGVFQLRQRLATSGSDLKPIPAGVVEPLLKQDAASTKERFAAR